MQTASDKELSVNDLASNNELLTLTADIVSSHVANNSVALSDVPGMIASVHAALARLGTQVEPEKVQQDPAVSIRASVKPDYLVCLEDGKKLKMLKRHLMTSYGMTPDGYRAKWKLPADYPMVAPAYAEQRRSLAIKIGLGRKAPPAPAVEAVSAKKPRSLRAKLAPAFDAQAA
ncbi:MULTISPECIES: MucR family transcriptional regulator [Sphingosinicellaceae]|uniref:MucR family transcriptional regulator n=1 Tax=Sphingosinicellaceae TaxID=2820280 RepID=UPI001C1E6755|nr:MULTISPECIES: MucR family transcriptional regulator [Polymorphobacter]QYE33521.1 MucR family transcriptional regulator [Polymorphobacter sp. PAMC 29334]UAJ12216.1 MucR family transcriptional regulator [Polymorphobacter megasporae]